MLYKLKGGDVYAINAMPPTQRTIRIRIDKITPYTRDNLTDIMNALEMTLGAKWINMEKIFGEVYVYATVNERLKIGDIRRALATLLVG